MVDIVSKPKLAVQKPSAVLMSLQRVQEEELHTVSQNLANSQHAGYKAFILGSEQSIYKTKDKQQVSYVKATGNARDLTGGSVKTTSHVLDFAIGGNGYFTIQTTDGNRYTRNGRFKTDDTGRLITHAGHFVLDQNGGLITLPKNINNFHIAQNGVMSANGQNIGQIGIATFQNEQSMTLEGNSLLKTSEDPTPHPDPVVFQGGYEESNVSPISASIQLMNIMHRYEEAQKMIENFEQLQRETMNAKAQTA